MRTARITPIVLALLMAAGCGGSPEDVHATYSPVPDARLFAQVRELPGVTRAHVFYASDFNGKGYYGNVWVRRGVDARKTLDRVFAILWQGRPEAAIGSPIEVDRLGKPLVSALDLGLKSYSDWVKRYGPQPGDGKPPA